MPYLDYLFVSDVSIVCTILFLLVVSIALVENGMSALLTAFVLVGLLACQIWNFTDVKPLEWLWNNPLTFITLVAIYALTGVVWSYIKWVSYLASIRRDYVKNPSAYQYAKFPPSVAANKYRIMTWMMYWPPSLVWTVIHDPVYRFFNMLYHLAAGSFQRISDRMFNDIVAERKNAQDK